MTVASLCAAAVWLFAPELAQAAVTFGDIGHNVADSAKGVAKGITVTGFAAGAGMRGKQLEYSNRPDAKPVEYLGRVLDESHPSEQEMVDSLFPLEDTITDEQLSQAHVHGQHLLAVAGKGRCQILRRGGFTHAALFVGDDNAAHRFSLVMQSRESIALYKNIFNAQNRNI